MMLRDAKSFPNVSPVSAQNQSTTKRKRINVHSFDFDGCLFNIEYVVKGCYWGAGEKEKEAKFFTSNQQFFDKLAARLTKEKYDDIIFKVGSNRQSHSVDRANLNRSTREGYFQPGSCFPWMEKIADRLKSPTGIQGRVDTFLLSDLYGNVPDGTNFNAALAGKKVSDWYFDEGKFTLLYAQIHRIATQNPNADIRFDFYDDRDDILNCLIKKFAKYPELLPSNVKLCLHKYDGTVNEQLTSIQGTGEMDYHYVDNIKAVAVLFNVGDLDNIPSDKQIRLHEELNIPAFLNYRYQRSSLINGLTSYAKQMESKIHEQTGGTVLDSKLVLSESHHMLNAIHQLIKVIDGKEEKFEQSKMDLLKTNIVLRQLIKDNEVFLPDNLIKANTPDSKSAIASQAKETDLTDLQKYKLRTQPKPAPERYSQLKKLDQASQVTENDFIHALSEEMNYRESIAKHETSNEIVSLSRDTSGRALVQSFKKLLASFNAWTGGYHFTCSELKAMTSHARLNQVLSDFESCWPTNFAKNMKDFKKLESTVADYKKSLGQNHFFASPSSQTKLALLSRLMNESDDDKIKLSSVESEMINNDAMLKQILANPLMAARLEKQVADLKSGVGLKMN